MKEEEHRKAGCGTTSCLAVTALAAADMALSGVKSVIPSDEVVQVMLEVG